ncbi:hypothetical protein MRBLMC3_002934 [Sphingobium sp. LMC3-1-1.1]|uniref:hypothetical protein n=1 Tax=Sphingobium sp. LMC3-1-1.1 TaxID=3135241 RepID=UPI00343870D2
MARYKDGLKVATCLFEAAAWHYCVKAICTCGHAAVFDPHGLWYHFHRRGLDDRMGCVREKLWCRECGRRYGKRVRPVTLELVRELPSITLPLPDEREWKRIVNSFRG